MKIFATSAYATHEMLDALQVMAANDKLGNHSLCNSAEEADVIAFIENTHFNDYLYKTLRQHPLVKQYPEKVFMYNESDKPWSALPGLYCSMPRRFFQHSKQVAFPYLVTPNDFIKDVHTWDTEKRWLFSFVGSASHRCRREVVELANDSKGVQDTSEFNVWDCTKDTKAAQGINFARTMAETKFMLCPRGIGTSSFRLFETLEAARAPVIIADQWVPTPHIDWDFAVRISERKIHTIPDVLRSIEDEADDRGRAARAAWESAYAPDVLFDTVAESLAWLLEERRNQTANHPLTQSWVAIYRLETVNVARLLCYTGEGGRKNKHQTDHECQSTTPEQGRRSHRLAKLARDCHAYGQGPGYLEPWRSCSYHPRRIQQTWPTFAS